MLQALPFPQHPILLSKLNQIFFWRHVATVSILTLSGKHRGIPQNVKDTIVLFPDTFATCLLLHTSLYYL